MSDAIITVENLTKAYRIWEHPSARLKSPLLETAARVFPQASAPYRALAGRAARGYRDFYALRDVSFTVRRGEATGIIGRNGSGKSTLLQLIAGTLTPTGGRVAVNGRVSALLELGSGFNPDFTGRENVFISGSIVGFTMREIESRFDEIAAFADIGDFIEQPVKTYSNGMMVRLAFAVATATQPDILIVDEALSVGDVFFQQKCFARIRAMLADGTSLLFVSHDIGAVQNLCDRALLLKEGAVVFAGPPEEAASRYYAISSGAAAPAANAARRTVAPPPAPALTELKAEILAHNILPKARSRHGIHELEVAAACFVNECGLHSLSVEMLQTVQIHLLLRANREIPDPSAGLHLFDRMNNVVFAAGTRQLHTPLHSFQAGEERILTFRLTMAVQPGPYTFSLGCSEPSLDGPNHGFVQDRHEGLGPIEVRYDAVGTWPFYGIARLPMEVAVVG
ncbi:MAG: ABC transporter ATP-binding protein [Opitutaceae bacterium]|nr:ABC transporter ATP-binding protein [Opitutaceae bacterium]